MKKWRVCKKVTEYHYFVIEAEGFQEALDSAEDYYCDSDDADNLDMVVVSVEEEE